MLYPAAQSWRLIFLLALFLIFISTLLLFHRPNVTALGEHNFPFFRKPPRKSPKTTKDGTPPGDEKPPLPKQPLFKLDPEIPPSNIVDALSFAHHASDLPPIPSWNAPPTTHVKEPTPLFIAMTRNWPLLQQTVISYLTAGWPAKDIYVLDNTGTFDANRRGLLSLQNPSFVNYTRLEKVLGVNVITAPVLVTFAQVQNFFLREAQINGWETYWWAHQDSPIVSHEDRVDSEGGYKSAYAKSVELLRDTQKHGGRWAFKWMAYDRLSLVNRAAMEDVGGYDTSIPFYSADCDMNERLFMNGWTAKAGDVGHVLDLGAVVEDVRVFWRRDPDHKDLKTWAEAKEDQRGSREWLQLVDRLWAMDSVKQKSSNRNGWQQVQNGGKGEPYWRDPWGFEEGLGFMIRAGQDTFNKKWGHRSCGIIDAGLQPEHAWRVLPDWDFKMEKNEKNEWHIDAEERKRLGPGSADAVQEKKS